MPLGDFSGDGKPESCAAGVGAPASSRRPNRSNTRSALSPPTPGPSSVTVSTAIPLISCSPTETRPSRGARRSPRGSSLPGPAGCDPRARTRRTRPKGRPAPGRLLRCSVLLARRGRRDPAALRCGPSSLRRPAPIEEILDHRLHCDDLGEERFERLSVVLVAQRCDVDFDPSSQPCQRAAEFVGGVGRESLLTFCGRLETLEHLIHRCSE